jgi:hypothetical protein
MLRYEVVRFRSNEDRRPWHVDFYREQGVDAGGLARELASELALDLCEPRCGLVVPTPNARNKVGDFMDCVLPSPDPQHGRLEQQYTVAGALIGICIRSQLVQDFNFPPLVWEFLVTGQVSIERVFDVDQNYKSLIASLSEAEACGMEPAEFASKFQLKFTVFNVRGEEVPLTQRGKSEMVTISNCGHYIAMANEFRRNELKQYLEWMRTGFWDNMGFSPIPGMSWRALEFCACGEKTVDIATLRQVT